MAFKRKFTFYHTAGHELIHVAHFKYFGLIYVEKFSEAACYRWNYQEATASGPGAYKFALNRLKMSYSYYNPNTFWNRLFGSNDYYK